MTQIKANSVADAYALGYQAGERDAQTTQAQTGGMTWLPMSEAPRGSDMRIVAWDTDLDDWQTLIWHDGGWIDSLGFHQEEKTLTHFLVITPPH